MNDLYWKDDSDKSDIYQMPDDIIDINYKIEQCKTLPLDHAQALKHALVKALPWLEEEPLAAIHNIHVAASGNGWMRPSDPETQCLHVSRRTRMSLRIPKHRLDQAHELTGQQLDIAGHCLTVGSGTIKPLSKLTTLFARYVTVAGATDETTFMHSIFDELKQLGIKPKKMLPGREQPIQTDNGAIITRSLMLADLDVEDSVQLQQRGLGEGRKLGCGIFLPHKGIEALKKIPEKLG